MDEPRCSAPTVAGTACRRLLQRCDIPGHLRWRGRAGALPIAPGGAPASDARAVPAAIPAAVVDRDLRALAWWLIERVLTDALKPSDAGIVAGIMRLVASLGPAEMTLEEALKDIELLGLVMNGVPPRVPEEWARAEELFDEDAVAEFRRWTPLTDRRIAADADAED